MIDGKVVEGDYSGDMERASNYFYDGAITYDGHTIKMQSIDYDDGEGGTYSEDFVPSSYKNPALYNGTGVAISEGSTFTLHHHGDSYNNGDANGSIHWHYKVVFVPKND